MSKITVHSIETFGTHEGPGIRLVIFVQGCNFRCVYCHNPDTQAVIGGREMHAAEVIELLRKEKPYFKDTGGLTVSGGEPLLQRLALIDVFAQVRQAGFHTTLDTNGSILDEDTKKLLAVTDLVLLDIKHINPVWHRKVTGSGNANVLKFAEYRESTGKPMWLRLVYVPGYTDQETYLHEWGKQFQNYTSIERVEILPYHTFGEYKYKQLGREYVLNGVKPPSQKSIQKAVTIFKQYFREVYVR
jgi:pyruvate formate lyase activating enzyme